MKPNHSTWTVCLAALALAAVGTVPAQTARAGRREIAGRAGANPPHAIWRAAYSGRDVRGRGVRVRLLPGRRPSAQHHARHSRNARSELAQSFGAGEKNKNVEADFFSRQFRVYSAGGRELSQARSRLSRDGRRLCRRAELLRRAPSRAACPTGCPRSTDTTWRPMAWRA